jgi:hypothetical protein
MPSDLCDALLLLDVDFKLGPKTSSSLARKNEVGCAELMLGRLSPTKLDLRDRGMAASLAAAVGLMFV